MSTSGVIIFFKIFNVHATGEGRGSSFEQTFFTQGLFLSIKVKIILVIL